jgi:hypothetical protein
MKANKAMDRSPKQDRDERREEFLNSLAALIVEDILSKGKEEIQDQHRGPDKNILKK